MQVLEVGVRPFGQDIAESRCPDFGKKEGVVAGSDISYWAIVRSTPWERGTGHMGPEVVTQGRGPTYLSLRIVFIYMSYSLTGRLDIIKMEILSNWHIIQCYSQ